MIYPIIVAGGTGTRLWPLSRSNYPKQFIPLCGEYSMLQETLLRLNGMDHHAPMIICNEENRFITAEQVKQLKLLKTAILLEPVGRNTAPAIALAAFIARKQGEDPLLLVLAADHLIKNAAAFHAAVAQATELAEQGKLVTFGVVPAHAETGYGYIRRGEVTATGLLDDPVYKVMAFVEKPDMATAEAYLASGDYYWNSGIFMFKASRYLAELKQFRPDIYQCCQDAVAQLAEDLDFIRIDNEAFRRCPEESIDYAVMEKTKDAVVVPLDAGWNDVGGFAALWQVASKDEQNNVLRGEVFLHNSHHLYVHSDDKLIAVVGVQDLVIVNTKDAVLVAHKDHTQDIKHIVSQLKAACRPEVNVHREVYRPWGKYDSVDLGPRFQVKRISVKPGAKLSVQMHHHRAEHWIVVSGTARVTINGVEQFITENQSVYIPVTAVHALENPGKVLLELIEVQSGSYLGEDDIVRFEDRYGRT
ncbi:mannose-1-phosphate guanylyltransferase/mannose-6-phosphate isomerase [Rheinheimera sp. 1928-s]|uniref:mannose-1-phosphate guanylyltransferase/mannose-6-phosphate isomerase n=1 Tax=Rheinheimera sp. 1928-s TaxID=3033803 RepID=UPI002605EA1C|nr:mannose-1-phosphate guanylyltransferase/mannose-6-phosphate isomerase [Rheinheimera sp. 1928-s]MDF3125677.1 mannose-1-phosphate guanylyltransferase/mannose-6-phosphate isomerase [Rheinheimera sp. 1928-s]